MGYRSLLCSAVAELVLHRMQAFKNSHGQWRNNVMRRRSASNWDYPQLGEGVCKTRHGDLSNQQMQNKAPPAPWRTEAALLIAA